MAPRVRRAASPTRPARARSEQGAALSTRAFQERFDGLTANVEKVIKGKNDVVRLALVALFSEGHVLFEDVPGVGKSMLARSIGKSIEASESRIQCTADMLPSDITGTSVLDQKTYEFSFRPGPVFANILLADEINRATPKTQSALLEAMAEHTVTVDGVTHPLPRPFLVLATQNPVELAGTFPLPEAQLDRFLFRLAMGYPEKEAEKDVLRASARAHPIDSLTPVMDTEEALAMIDWAAGVTVNEPVLEYIVELCSATRAEPAFTLGAGPRASLALMWATRVLAASEGREDVYPDDVKTLLPAVMGHRVMLSPDASLRGDTVETVLERVQSRVRPPTPATVAASTNGKGH
ncbi:MAG: MoxR-like ATPase [Acidimicrobiaceae bacterium]|jgi:MoxR-like ATPase|nr:MoxR-like ATPase [Acidimicrobiaceae bacterium]MDQ1446463.1 MoxR-like ATPase [Acidimicrobiaceae bacterium]